MSLIHAVTIRCNGCGTTYRPQQRASTGREARADAAARGWSEWQGRDNCGTCGPAHTARTKRPRGVCAGCGRDKPLTDQGLIYQHPAAGTGRPFGWCDGGERPPVQEGTR